MATSDVTIVAKRKMAIYAYCNLICFIVQVATVFFLVQQDFAGYLFTDLHNEYNESEPRIPIKMQAEFETTGWLFVAIFQGLFVLRGLPCMNPGPHYVNTLILKIKFSFCLLCILLTSSMFSFQMFLSLTKNTWTWYYIAFLFIPLSGYFLLKLTVQYLLYNKVKYKDDGRELVNFADYVTIQITFPLINCWITYQTLYSLFQTMAELCPIDPAN